MPIKSGLSPRFGLSKQLRIGILLGGSSPERKISLKSGRAVEKALLKAGYQPVCLDPEKLSTGQLLSAPVDVFFIALHGHGGEDGALQALLDRKGVPYTGSDLAGCRNSFDKARSKRLFATHHIPTPVSLLLTRANFKKQLSRLEEPCFVKPVDDGSSLGIYCLARIKGQEARLQKSVEKYGKILVERKIEGREFTVGVLGERALPVIELRPTRKFYDFQAKYTKGMCKYLAPAPISDNLTLKLQRLARKTHRALGLRDFSRVDFMVDRDQHPYVLEANAIPGLTEFSLLPKAAQIEGYSFERLCMKMIALALKRKSKK